MKELREKKEDAFVLMAVGLPGIISENASLEENSTFKWLKRTMYQPARKLDGNADSKIFEVEL